MQKYMSACKLFTKRLQRQRSLRPARLVVPMVSMAVMFVALIGWVPESIASYCATQTGIGVIYCEDFSSPNPLAAYTLLNPYADGPLVIGIDNEALLYTNTSAGLGSAATVYNGTLEFRDTGLEADIRFERPDASLRSAMAIEWSDGAPKKNRISWFFQLDEQRAYLFIRINGTDIAPASTPVTILPNVTYRLRLEVNDNNRIKGYFNGVLIMDRSVDLSGLPLTLSPTFLGNSYPSTPLSNFRFDNALVRQIRPVLSCVGFEPPMDQLAVTVNKNRALPLKAQLIDSHGTPITAADLPAPPVLQVSYDPGTGVAEDVSDEALPAGQATQGNQFVFTEDKWQFNLLTKNYTAPGTYTLTIVQGDNYLIDPACVARFVIK